MSAAFWRGFWRGAAVASMIFLGPFAAGVLVGTFIQLVMR